VANSRQILLQLKAEARSSRDQVHERLYNSDDFGVGDDSHDLRE
jgi:hypothetical protein